MRELGRTNPVPSWTPWVLLLAGCGGGVDGGKAGLADLSPPGVGTVVDASGDDGGSDSGAGGPCPGGGWGAFSADDAVVVVSVGGREGADGSEADPVATLDGALALARATPALRSVLVLPGTHVASVALTSGATGTTPDDGLHISGCDRELSILQAADDASSVLHVAGITGFAASHLTLQGGRRALLVDDAEAVLTSLIVADSRRSGIVFEGSDTGVVAQDLMVRTPISETWTGSDGATRSTGYGVFVSGVGSLDITSMEISGAAGVGLLVDAKSSIDVDGLWVHSLVADAAGLGRGVQLQGESGGVLAGVRVSDALDVGIVVVDSFDVELSGAAVDAPLGVTLPDASDTTGDGVVVARTPDHTAAVADMHVTMDNCVVTSPSRAGVILSGVTGVLRSNVVSGAGYTVDGISLLLQDGAVLASGSIDATESPPVPLAFNSLLVSGVE